VYSRKLPSELRYNARTRQPYVLTLSNHICFKFITDGPNNGLIRFAGIFNPDLAGFEGGIMPDTGLRKLEVAVGKLMERNLIAYGRSN
jgi:hypothetical protein